MSTVILNQRRVPRAPARCEVRCLLPGGAFWAADTTDVSPRGCQLPAPGPFKVGDPLKLTLSIERVEEGLAATGRVAWASRNPPWRIGVAFDDPFVGETAGWFEKLVAAYPELATYRMAPDSIDVTARLFPGPAPRLDPGLGPDEVAVLRALGAGASVAKLRDLLHADWPAIEGCLFAMIGKQHLTLDPGAAGKPEDWAGYLRPAG